MKRRHIPKSDGRERPIGITALEDKIVQKATVNVLEDGRLEHMKQGTPQGGCISPLLANIYLHYVFDLWAERWRKRNARGEVILVRYADDIRVGFQNRGDAVRFQAAMRERIRKFGLELHPEKTRALEFGRYAQERRARRGEGRPNTFTFLGFVHACGKTANGGFMVRRKPDPQRMREKLREIKEEIRRKVRMPVPKQGAWLRSVVQGYFNYFAVPGTTETLSAFRRAVVWSWYRALRRRSQRTRLTWERMLRLTKQWLPAPRIIHPNPFERLCV